MALFTVETAGDMARKAVQAREAKKEADRLAALEPPVIPDKADEFRQKRLSRVRRQLDAIDKAISAELEKETMDAGKLDRLASAAIRLNEQERQLSNRSLPPTLKANAVNPRRKPSTTDASDPFEEA